MRKTLLFSTILTLLFCSGVFADDSFPGGGNFFNAGPDIPAFGDIKTPPDTYINEDSGSIKVSVQHTVVNPGADSAIALEFHTSDGWHYYADKKAIPIGQLTITPSGEGLVFGEAVFPDPKEYDDKDAGNKYGIYDENFIVYIPFKAEEGSEDGKKSIPITVKIEGAVCADVCIFLNNVSVITTIDIDSAAVMPAVAFEFSAVDIVGIVGPEFSMLFAFSLALLAGLAMNVMPCVWPIIPIVIARLWSLSGKSRGKSIGMGIGFSTGILLFFAIIAGANIVLRLGFGTVMQWGDLNREPAFNIGLSMLMVVMGLFMFGLFTFALPSSISGKTSSGEGFSGSIGMGFLLALLSTPCGFGILAAAFAWAQSQPLGIATFTIMLIGVGMALPYIVLTSIPGLLNRLPKPGGWMDHVKYILGFLMLLIAVKILSAVPQDMRINTLYFAVFLSLAVWIWGWVTMTTTRGHKVAIRAVAIIIVVSSGWLLLSGTADKAVDWLEYDSAAISQDIEDGRPVLIKFTADWCFTCTIIDKTVYSKKEVADFLKQKGVRPYLADTTLKNSPATKDLSGIYKEPTVPATVILLPDGTEKHIVGKYTQKKLREILEHLDDIEGFDGEEDSEEGNEEEDDKAKETEGS